jgi:hypothetical protein
VYFYRLYNITIGSKTDINNSGRENNDNDLNLQRSVSVHSITNNNEHVSGKQFYSPLVRHFDTQINTIQYAIIVVVIVHVIRLSEKKNCSTYIIMPRAHGGCPFMRITISHVVYSPKR